MEIELITGIFGYPIDRCAQIMTDAVNGFAPRARSLQKVIFYLFGADAMRELTAAMREIRR